MRELDTSQVWEVIRCQNKSCKRLSFVIVDINQAISLNPEGTKTSQRIVFPYRNPERDNYFGHKVPLRVKEIYNQGSRCLASESYDIAFLAYRTVLELAFNLRGIKGRNLQAKMKKACNSIESHTAFEETLNEIRKFGNNIAHSKNNPEYAASRKKAEKASRATRVIIQYLFEFSEHQKKTQEKFWNMMREIIPALKGTNAFPGYTQHLIKNADKDPP